VSPPSWRGWERHFGWLANEGDEKAVNCPNCRQQHQMAGIRYWLTPLELLESMHNEVAKAA